MPDPPRNAQLGALGEVGRLGLATRGGSRLERADVLEALRRGVTYLNWCGRADGLSAAVRGLGDARRRVLVAAQLESRSARGAERELQTMLSELETTHLDALTHYYVESAGEWEEILAPGGSQSLLETAKARGIVRAIGITSHQRSLTARIIGSGRLDLAMVRYNAAHRGAEDDVFPAARGMRLPVVAFTGLRWGALLEPTPGDPPGFTPPRAPDCYRFVLEHPAVTVALMAPGDRSELEEDLQVLDDWRGLTPEERQALRAHGDRVRRHAESFP